jgi:hypothetical protein
MPETFDLESAYVRLEVAGAAPTSVALERSGPGAFVAVPITTLSVAAAAYATETTSGLGTVSSGDLLRTNWTAIGSPGAAYTVELEGVQQ